MNLEKNRLFLIEINDIKEYVVSGCEEWAKNHLHNSIVDRFNRKFLKELYKKIENIDPSEREFYFKQREEMDEKLKKIASEYSVENMKVTNIDRIVWGDDTYEVELKEVNYYTKCGENRYMCRKCYELTDSKYPYCPHCGSPMSTELVYNEEIERVEEDK